MSNNSTSHVTHIDKSRNTYESVMSCYTCGVATVIRIDEIISLFCRISSLL